MMNGPKDRNGEKAREILKEEAKIVSEVQQGSGGQDRRRTESKRATGEWKRRRGKKGDEKEEQCRYGIMQRQF